MFQAVHDPVADERGRDILTKLFSTVQRDRASGAAHALLKEFGSLPAVLGAGRPAQTRVLGSEPALIHCLGLVREAMLHAFATELDAQPVLATSEGLLRYLHTAMAHAKREHVRILYLDSNNRLLADEIDTTGTVNSAQLYPREIMRRALELGASALILVHNHPSGNPEPSFADIQGTRSVLDAARTLDITVHDHLVIARGGHTSMRQRGLL